MEISNRTLAILLVVAIVLAVGGALINLRTGGITGMGSGTGYVNVTISEDTTIAVEHPDIDFGSGYIVGTNQSAQLTSIGGIINWSGTGTSNSITILNNGNVNVTVTVDAERNATFFFLNQSGLKKYSFKTLDNETGSCATLVAAYTEFDQTAQTICTHLGSGSANSIDLVVSLEFGTTIQGTFTDTLTLASSAS